MSWLTEDARNAGPPGTASKSETVNGKLDGVHGSSLHSGLDHDNRRGERILESGSMRNCSLELGTRRSRGKVWWVALFRIIRPISAGF
jgi:hypothetical protein